MTSINRIGSSVIELRDGSKSIEYWIALRNYLETSVDGLEEVLNTEDSVVLIFEQQGLCDESLIKKLVTGFQVTTGNTLSEPRIFKVPVSYSSSNTDLSEVAKKLKLSEEDVVLKHSEAIYQISMFGFMPGFAYLTGLPKPLQLPRKQKPSLQIPSGSVAIAEHYSGIYPVDSPGGWYVLGYTDFSFLTQAQNNERLPTPGDCVKFIPTIK